MTSEMMTPQAFKILENVIFLKKTPLFASMRTHDLRAVAAVVEELTFEADEEVVREKDVGDALYIIKEGSIRITKKVGEHDSVQLAEMNVGECFGDMAVFDAELRSASAFAQGRCVLLRLNGEDLIDVVVECPYIAIEFLKMFVKRLRKSNAKVEDLTGKLSALGESAPAKGQDEL